MYVLERAITSPTSTRIVIIETLSSTPNALMICGDLTAGTRLNRISRRQMRRKATPAADKTSDIVCPDIVDAVISAPSPLGPDIVSDGLYSVLACGRRVRAP